MDLLQQTSGVGAAEKHPLAAAARRRLQRCPYRAVRTLECEYHQGSLVLRGKLASYFFKQLAQESVAGVHGVDRVVNEIEVLGCR
jgi:osmotically-inducible protein OsmY